jgi:hypothetical protein
MSRFRNTACLGLVVFSSLALCMVASTACADLTQGKTMPEDSAQYKAALIYHNNFCDQHYTDIDAIYWSTTNSLPPALDTPSWSEVEKNIGEVLETLVSKNTRTTTLPSGIPVMKTTETPETILSKHPKSLYLNVSFSIGHIVAMGIGPETALMIFVYASHNEVRDAQTRKAAVSHQFVGLSKFDLDNQAAIKYHLASDDPSRYGSNSYFYGPLSALTDVICTVLASTSNKMCTSIRDPYKNTVVLMPIPCKTIEAIPSKTPSEVPR